MLGSSPCNPFRWPVGITPRGRNRLHMLYYCSTFSPTQASPSAHGSDDAPYRLPSISNVTTAILFPSYPNTKWIAAEIIPSNNIPTATLPNVMIAALILVTPCMLRRRSNLSPANLLTSIRHNIECPTVQSIRDHRYLRIVVVPRRLNPCCQRPQSLQRYRWNVDTAVRSKPRF